MLKWLKQGLSGKAQVTVYLEPLVKVFSDHELKKGSPLSRQDVANILSKLKSVQMTDEEAAKFYEHQATRFKLPQIKNPQRAYEEWQHIRIRLG